MELSRTNARCLWNIHRPRPIGLRTKFIKEVYGSGRLIKRSDRDEVIVDEVIGHPNSSDSNAHIICQYFI